MITGMSECATILLLYMRRDDKYWMVRVLKKWHAAAEVSTRLGVTD